MAGMGEPSAVMTIAGRYSATSRRSSARRALVLCVTRLTAHGAASDPASWSLIFPIQASRSSTVRQFGAGNDPTIPDLQAATTRSGPEMRNIGAATTGSRSPGKVVIASSPLIGNRDHDILRVSWYI